MTIKRVFRFPLLTMSGQRGEGVGSLNCCVMLCYII